MNAGEEGLRGGRANGGAHQQAIKDAILYDWALGNTDRHGGNWTYDKEKLARRENPIGLIDHGLALGDRTSNFRYTDFLLALPSKSKEAITPAMKKTFTDAAPKMVERMRQYGLPESNITAFNARIAVIQKSNNFRDLVNEWRGYF